MNQTVAVWLLIALAAVCANLPFLNERLFAVFVWRRHGVPGIKPFWVRLVEVLVWFGVVGAIGYGFESALGNAFPQGWPFYVIGLCLFLVLGYPGFVLRYLTKRSDRVSAD